MKLPLLSALLALSLPVVNGWAVPAPAPVSPPATESAPAATPAVVPSASPVTATPPLTDLVDDQTAFALIISDVPGLLRGWDASPMARTWNDEQVVKYFAPLRHLMQVDTWDDQARAATGKSVRELLALARGQALVALPASAVADALGGKPAPDSAPAPLPLLVAVELGDNAGVVEKLAADAAAKNENLRVETTNYAGVLIHTSLAPAPKDGGKAGGTTVTAMCQGIWLLSPSYDRVCAAVDAIKQGGLPNALGRTEPYLRARERAGAAQVIAVGNLPAIYPALLASAQKQPASDLPFTPEALLKGLGLDALGEFVYTVNFGDQETRVTASLGWQEERGLVKLLAFGPGGALRPDWVPARWINVSAAKWDLRATYAALEEMLGAISPQLLASAQAQVKAAGDQMGIDLKRDLIGSLGSDLVTATALPPDADPSMPPAPDKLDQIYAIALENPAAFIKAVEGVKLMAFGPAADKLFAKREYLGQDLYTFTPPTPAGAAADAPPAKGFSYAIAGHTLLVGVGSPSGVEAALQGMAEKRPSFWDKPEVKTALADVPEDACSVQVTDLRVLVSGMLGMFAALPLPAGPAGGLVDPSARPDSDRLAKYWALGSGYMVKEGKGFFTVSRIANPQP